MTHDEHLNSIEAVKACMDHLKLARDVQESGVVRANLTKANGKKIRFGVIGVEFKNDVHAHRGPWIEFDDTVRGYGLRYTQFTPQYYEYSWDADTCCLSVKDDKDSDSFTLQFAS